MGRWEVDDEWKGIGGEYVEREGRLWKRVEKRIGIRMVCLGLECGY